MYYGTIFPGLPFSFRCFVDNSTLFPGPILDYLLTLLAYCLLASAYFISHQWISIHSLCNSDKQSSTAGVYIGCTTISIGEYNLQLYTILQGILPLGNYGMASMNILTSGKVPTHLLDYTCMHNMVQLVTLAIPSING